MTPLAYKLYDELPQPAVAAQHDQLAVVAGELLRQAQRLRRAARRSSAPADLADMLRSLEAALDSLAVTAAELRVAVLSDLAAGHYARERVVAADVARHFTDLQRALADGAASCGDLRAGLDR
jgi:hypothetical protein